MADLILGFDGCSSDEVVTEYVRRGDRLIARCWGREHEVDPGEAAAELDRRAAVNREMADICRGYPSDYPARIEAQERAAAAIRAAFPVEAR
jgi:hypothetical protein